MFGYLFLFSLAVGQLIKIPLMGWGGITALDIFIFLSSIFLLWKLKFKLKNPPIFISVAIFFIFTGILSLFLTPLNLKSGELIISFLYIVRFFFYILFGWLAYSQSFLKLKLDEVFIKAGLILSVLGLLQLAFLPDLRFLQNQGWDPHFFRTVSTFLDPNFLGAFLSLSLLLLLRGKISPPITLMFIIIYLALLTTFSRGSYLMFGVSFLALALLRRSRRLLGLTIFLSILLFVGFSVYQHVVASPRGIDREKSAEYRLNSWEEGWQIFQKNPILGVGFNAYRFALRQYRLAPDQSIKSHGASSNDSSLLFVAATTGVLGLLVYLLFLGSFVWYAKGNPIFLSGLAGLVAQSFFANILFYPFLLIWIILYAVFEKPK